MRHLALALLSLTAAGCALGAAMEIIKEDPDATYAREEAAKVLNCPAESLRAVKDRKHADQGFPWTITGSGRGAACNGSWKEWRCRTLPLPFWVGTDHEPIVRASLRDVVSQTNCAPGGATVMPPVSGLYVMAICDRDFWCRQEINGLHCDETAQSLERTARSIAVDRLAVETTCPKNQIEINEATDWTRGTERAFRMTACGKAYVCTTAAGRTDCKAALAQEGAPTAQP